MTIHVEIPLLLLCVHILCISTNSIDKPQLINFIWLYLTVKRPKSDMMKILFSFPSQQSIILNTQLHHVMYEFQMRLLIPASEIWILASLFVVCGSISVLTFNIASQKFTITIVILMLIQKTLKVTVQLDTFSKVPSEPESSPWHFQYSTVWPV